MAGEIVCVPPSSAGTAKIVVLACGTRLVREQEESHDTKHGDKMGSPYYHRAPPSVHAEQKIGMPAMSSLRHAALSSMIFTLSAFGWIALTDVARCPFHDDHMTP